MGQSKPLALVVENDEFQRELASVVLEECEIDVICCDTAEAATLILEIIKRQPAMLFADAQLPGVLTGADLAHIVRAKFPDVRLLVTSGDDRPPPLPHGTRFMPKPWAPLDLIREAVTLANAQRPVAA
jgi:CheY-like chemotaxis protein